MATQTTNKSNKGMTIVTYVIALAFLVAGLFIPMYGGSENVTDRMLFKYMPGAINSAVGKTVLTFGWFRPFTELYRTKIFGGSVNVYAWSLVLYFVVTILGLFFLIPVLSGKKTKNTSAVCAYIIEIAATIVLSLYFVFAMAETPIATWQNYSFLVPFAGIIVILFVQAILNKKNLGVTKIILFLLSAVALLCLYNVAVWITPIAPALTSFANLLNAELSFGAGNWGINYFVNNIINIQNIGNNISGLNATGKALAIFLSITSLLVFLNYIIDLIALATSSKRDSKNRIKKNTSSKLFSLIRYSLELVLAFVAFLLILAERQPTGLYLYFILIISLIQLIITICRLYHNKSIARANDAEERIQISDEIADQTNEEYVDVTVNGNTVVAQEPVQQQIPVPQQPVQQQPVQPAPVEQPVEPIQDTQNEQMQINIAPQPVEKAPAETRVVYNVVSVYNGPTDAFIETLTDEEKIEFAKVFIEKSKGTLPNSLHDYQVGEENKDFFTDIFIYLTKFRNLLSPELLAKIYKHINSTK